MGGFVGILTFCCSTPTSYYVGVWIDENCCNLLLFVPTATISSVFYLDWVCSTSSCSALLRWTKCGVIVSRRCEDCPSKRWCLLFFDIFNTCPSTFDQRFLANFSSKVGTCPPVFAPVVPLTPNFPPPLPMLSPACLPPALCYDLPLDRSFSCQMLGTTNLSLVWLELKRAPCCLEDYSSKLWCWPPMSFFDFSEPARFVVPVTSYF